jgi:hypothetical protein
VVTFHGVLHHVVADLVVDVRIVLVLGEHIVIVEHERLRLRFAVGARRGDQRGAVLRHERLVDAVAVFARPRLNLLAAALSAAQPHM